jgi:hypothetical protein
MRVKVRKKIMFGTMVYGLKEDISLILSMLRLIISLEVCYLVFFLLL